jgi:hypothetical protein
MSLKNIYDELKEFNLLIFDTNILQPESTYTNHNNLFIICIFDDHPQYTAEAQLIKIICCPCNRVYSEYYKLLHYDYIDFEVYEIIEDFNIQKLFDIYYNYCYNYLSNGLNSNECTNSHLNLIVENQNNIVLSYNSFEYDEKKLNKQKLLITNLQDLEKYYSVIENITNFDSNKIILKLF